MGMRMLCLFVLLLVSRVSALQLITDNKFQTGVKVKDVAGDIEGPMQYTTGNGNPIWSLAQWGSQASVYGSTPTVLSSGAYKWANQYKAVIMGPINTVDSDLMLSVNSISEYGGVYRGSKSDPWPHLLVSQGISEPNGNIGGAPWIDELTSLDFDIGAKLVYANNQHIIESGYDPMIHAAHFVVYFTIQNLNTSSSGYGDYMWFGLNLYDDRFPLPGPMVMQDGDGTGVKKGTGQLMYNVGLPFCTTGMVVGQWKDISGDILPLIKAGLGEAWSRGYLTESTDCADYKVGAMNMGWEVSGLSSVTMQVDNFGLEAYGLYWPKPYQFNVDGDTEGWSSSNLTDQGAFGPTSGTWIFTASANDPKLTGPAIRVDSVMYPKVKVRMANAGNPVAASVAQLFWKRAGDSSFTEGRSKKVNIGNGVGWVEYTFDMTGDPDWQGEITQLRLDPIYYGDGHSVGVDYIYFSE